MATYNKSHTSQSTTLDSACWLYLEGVEYRSDDMTKKTFFAFQCFEYHISVEHDEQPPQSKFGGIRFMGARDMAA